MATILSTKILAENQKQLLLNSGIGLVEYDAISIGFDNTSLDAPIPRNLIFTSKNGVKGFFTQYPEFQTRELNIFCVGEKTKAEIEKEGYSVIASADYGEELANLIVKDFQEKEFLHICGSMRREELSKILKAANFSIKELVVYNTRLNFRKFDSSFDGILFFSPSGVKSYCQENDINSSTAFCIGATTAAEAKKHTQHIIIANKPSIENVIVQAIKKYKI
ncbi:uroporphyrinogen-III synthase [Gillisia mitskevichiae]|uniref:Uroporphyrinogen-III synthase n=1 Tax=Gillisia mitskevichiae TaxID=270921 RepID=A0A495PXJ1_9FLAO|nr:uroporphyrinogen-III synthase [Gillisia mitskevichiae]RKS55277.1 uroporphyrinogen-III synthase [Gillisia mitskevichiae]